MKDYILIRYGELGLKKGNRPFFERKLHQNLKRARRGIGECPLHRLQGRLLAGPMEGDTEALAQAFARVFGVTSLSRVLRTEPDLDRIGEAATRVTGEWLEEHPGAGPVTCKIDVRRADKSFPLNSMTTARELGARVLPRYPRLKAKMKEPELLVEVDIRSEGTFVCAGRLPGPGGLPVGTQAPAMLLLSGGIDSPVAGWLAMKRGIRLQAVHFESRPYTSMEARRKVEDLAALLARWGQGLRLHIIPFTAIQEAIMEHCNHRYHTVLQRRAMHRLAQSLAREVQALALVTGEAVGQVASQTLENLALSDQVVEMPVLRPLITQDKEETIALAERIGTYPISVRPFEDCCTIFTPQRPVTRGKPEAARQEEERYPWQELAAQALAQVESRNF